MSMNMSVNAMANLLRDYETRKRQCRSESGSYDMEKVVKMLDVYNRDQLLVISAYVTH